MNQLSLRLPVEQPENIPQRKEAKKATRCSGCKHIVWMEDTVGGLCGNCAGPTEEKEERYRKERLFGQGPGPARPGGLNQVPVRNRLAAQ
jgi:hypothetical protein